MSNTNMRTSRQEGVLYQRVKKTQLYKSISISIILNSATKEWSDGQYGKYDDINTVQRAMRNRLRWLGPK